MAMQAMHVLLLYNHPGSGLLHLPSRRGTAGQPLFCLASSASAEGV